MEIVYKDEWNLPQVHPNQTAEPGAVIQSIKDPFSGVALPLLNLHERDADALNVRVVIRDEPESFKNLTEDEHDYILQQVANTVWFMAVHRVPEYQIPIHRHTEGGAEYVDYHVSMISSEIDGVMRHIANIREGEAPI